MVHDIKESVLDTKPEEETPQAKDTADLEQTSFFDNTANLSEEHLRFLAKLPAVLNSTLQLEKVISFALEKLEKDLLADDAAIVLVDQNTKQLNRWGLFGEREKQKKIAKQNWEKALPGTENIIKWVIESKSPLLLNTRDKENPNRFQVDEICSAIYMPLVTKNQSCIGVLEVFSKDPNHSFNSSDLALVDAFCHQVALAVENAKLFENTRKTKEKLVALDRQKSEIISILAHEFRTPLNIIQASADIIKSDNISEKEKSEMFDIMIRGVNRLTNLMSKIKDYASIESKQILVQKKECDINKIFEEIESSYSEICKSRKIKLIVCKTNFKVYADAPYLLIVIRNLISNAIRFTPDNGSICLKAEKNKHKIKISIKDNGIGIDNNELHLIFEKFYEISNSLSHSSGEHEFLSSGLGIGLASVRQILQAHNTKIDVISEKDKGSTFSFELSAYRQKPYSKPQEKDAID